MYEAIEKLLNISPPHQGRTYKVYILGSEEVRGHDLQAMQMADVVLRPAPNGFFEVVKGRYGHPGEFIPPSIARILFGIGES